MSTANALVDVTVNNSDNSYTAIYIVFNAYTNAKICVKHLHLRNTTVLFC